MTCDIEEDCQYDDYAVCVLKNNKKKIGYVPAFYSEFIKEVLMAKETDVIKLKYEFNPLAPSHYKFKLKVSGTVSEKIKRKFGTNLVLCC